MIRLPLVLRSMPRRLLIITEFPVFSGDFLSDAAFQSASEAAERLAVCFRRSRQTANRSAAVS